MAQRIINDIHARLRGAATLALLAFLAIGQRAWALELTGGPTDSLPGGGTCTRAGDLLERTLTLNCTVSNPGAFVDVYFGLTNNSAANSLAMDGTAPSGREIFRYSSTAANSLAPSFQAGEFPSITYTGATTIELAGSARNVNTRLVLTLTSGGGIVVDTAGTPANNANGDIQKLFRISGSAFSVEVAVLVNTLTIPEFLTPNIFLEVLRNPPVPAVITSVNLGFYYLECTP